MVTKFATMYANTDEGQRLPIVDVTNPAFALDLADGELHDQADRFVAESSNHAEIPPAVRAALAQSILGRAIAGASDSFLSGMHTYLLKLGPDHLPGPFTAIDRRIAASFPGLNTRIRLADMARLIADGVAPALTARADWPLSLVNFGGGPAADSWNALIHLRAEYAGVLQHRGVSIAVLDVDDGGPSFGARAVAVLAAPGGPLDGLTIDFRHVRYDWSDADRLPALLRGLLPSAAVCAFSSEGALFEYGSDAVVAANLTQLRQYAPAASVIVGSVTREGAPTRAAQAASRVPTHPRTLDAFAQLAGGAGWAIEAAIERPFTYNVRLVKAA